MEQASASARGNERMNQIVSAFSDGVILVDANGQVVWIDATTRRRLNGGLRDLVLPIRKSDRPVVDCFISTVDVMVEGERSTLCVIQQIDDQKDPGYDLVGALQAVMADSSWLTRAIIEKLKGLRQITQTSVRSPDDVDVLTGREREVLGLICEGRNDVEMSKMLHLSPNTVRNHIVSLYRKIGVNRRSAAIIWARERGITGLEVLAPKRRKHSPASPPDKTMSY